MKNKKIKSIKSNKPVALFRLRAAPVVALTASCLILGALSAPMAGANSLQDQINSLNAQNSQVQSSVNTLSVSASNYQGAINQLQSQIGSIQAAIVASQVEQANLNNEIQVYQTKLDKQKQILSSDIASMYVNGQMSTIEMLASSKSLSTFVDAQTYRNAVQNEVQNTMTQISQLQVTLNDQEKQVAQLLSSQQLQEQQLASDKQQQTQLLALNQQQQASYNQTLQTNNTQISKLNQEIAAINRSNSIKTLAAGGACDAADGDTYPVSLCAQPQDYVTDQWGLLNRECVSYAAWMEASQGRYVPYGLGDAGDWPANARAHGIRVDTTPEVGSIAIRPAFPDVVFPNGERDVGHAMYVEAVNGGQITVSEYNANLDGTFKREIKNISGNYNGHDYQLQFIHFQ